MFTLFTKLFRKETPSKLRQEIYILKDNMDRLADLSTLDRITDKRLLPWSSLENILEWLVDVADGESPVLDHTYRRAYIDLWVVEGNYIDKQYFLSVLLTALQTLLDKEDTLDKHTIDKVLLITGFFIYDL